MVVNGDKSAANGVCRMTVDGSYERADTGRFDTGEGARPFYRMYPDSELEKLMTRYQQGDFAAATALIDRLSPQLHRFFVVQSTCRGDADDLLQETWLRIHSVRHTYRSGEPLLPWLYAIARHIRIDHFRKTIRTATREHRRCTGFADDARTFAGEPARSDRNDEDCGDVAGRGGARDVIDCWFGKAEGASSL
jgi:DNA-directed RNA polymerase specialized sigma24 family protein